MKKPLQLREGDVLIGEHGGRSRVTGWVGLSTELSFRVIVVTEHGALYLDEFEEYEVES